MSKKVLSLFLAVSMVLSMVSVGAFAAEEEPMVIAPAPAAEEVTEAPQYNDVAGHWAEGAIDRWSASGVVKGDQFGNFNPNGEMTRAEAAQIFANLLGLTRKADVSGFVDVDANAWYADAMAACVEAGIIKGTNYPGTPATASPTALVTREQFFVMFSRALGLPEEPVAEKTLADSASVSSWAEGAINALVDKGYVKGAMDAAGNISVSPAADIDRASVMSLLNQTVTTYANKDGETVKASAEGVTLVVADNVTVTGEAADVVVAGESGGATLRDVKADTVVVAADDAKVNLAGKTAVDEAVVAAGDATLNVAANASVDTVSVAADAAGAQVTGSGDVAAVLSDTKDVKVSTPNTEVLAVETTANADGSVSTSSVLYTNDKNGKAGDVTATEATTVQNADGSETTTATATVTGANGKVKSTTESTTTVADTADGLKVESKSETKDAGGKVTETKETVSETKQNADGSLTTTATEKTTDAKGKTTTTETETTMKENADGSTTVSETEKVTDPNGKTTTIEKETTVAEKADGSTVTTENLKVTDANGKVTEGTKTTTETADGKETSTTTGSYNSANNAAVAAENGGESGSTGGGGGGYAPVNDTSSSSSRHSYAVSLDKTALTLNAGEISEALVATVTDNDAEMPSPTVTWTTSDAAVATVANGVVTAVAEGTATITATANGVSDTCAVTVRAADASKTFTVTFKSAADTDMNPVMAPQTITYDTATALSASTMAKSTDGTKTFQGWATTAGATEAEYYDQQEISLSPADVAAIVTAQSGSADAITLYAVWADRERNGLTVTDQPTKVDYVVGEAFAPSGLKVAFTYDNGETDASKVDYNADTMTLSGDGYDAATGKFTKAGNLTLTVAYGNTGYTADFAVTVVDAQLASISVKTAPTKTVYAKGETLDLAGLVITASYTNSTTKDVAYTGNEDAFSASGYNPATANDSVAQSVTITYTEDGISKTTTQAVYVKDEGIVSVTYVSGAPELSKVDGQEWDKSGFVGMKLHVVYKVAEAADITITANDLDDIVVSNTTTGTKLSATYKSQTITDTTEPSLPNVTIIATKTLTVKLEIDGTSTEYVQNAVITVGDKTLTAGTNEYTVTLPVLGADEKYTIVLGSTVGYKLKVTDPVQSLDVTAADFNDDGETVTLTMVADANVTTQDVTITTKDTAGTPNNLNEVAITVTDSSTGKTILTTKGGDGTTTVKLPVGTGYTVKGVKEGYQDAQVTDVEVKNEPGADDNKVALSLAKLFTVTFDSKGGSAVESQKVALNGKATKPADPTKEGYSFVKWVADDGTAESAAIDFAAATITADTTYDAIWEADDVTVTLNGNGGKFNVEGNATEKEGATKGTPANTATVTWKAPNGTVVNPKTYADDADAKVIYPGYKFSGWNTDAKGGGTPYAANTESITLTGDLTLYAQWAKKSTDGTLKAYAAAQGTDPATSGLTYGANGNETVVEIKAGVTDYSITVTNDVASIKVIPTATDNGATIKVVNPNNTTENYEGDAVDSGQASNAIDLHTGPQLIVILVQPEDETLEPTIYSLIVGRALPTVELTFKVGETAVAAGTPVILTDESGETYTVNVTGAAGAATFTGDNALPEGAYTVTKVGDYVVPSADALQIVVNATAAKVQTRNGANDEWEDATASTTVKVYAHVSAISEVAENVAASATGLIDTTTDDHVLAIEDYLNKVATVEANFTGSTTDAEKEAALAAIIVMKATIANADAVSPETVVTWTSTNTAVAEIDEETGALYPKAPGETTIVARADGKSKNYVLTVTATKAALKFTITGATLGEDDKLNVQANGANEASVLDITNGVATLDDAKAGTEYTVTVTLNPAYELKTVNGEDVEDGSATVSFTADDVKRVFNMDNDPVATIAVAVTVGLKDDAVTVSGSLKTVGSEEPAQGSTSSAPTYTYTAYQQAGTVVFASQTASYSATVSANGTFTVGPLLKGDYTVTLYKTAPSGSNEGTKMDKAVVAYTTDETQAPTPIVSSGKVTVSGSALTLVVDDPEPDPVT